MITVPPQMRNAGVDEMAYRHVAQQCYHRMMMARGQLNMFSQRFRLENGVEILCEYNWGKQDVCVKVPPVVVGTAEIASEVTISGLIFHPRSGEISSVSYLEYWRDEYGLINTTTYYGKGVLGGWANGGTELETLYLFPLNDTDNASMLMSTKSTSLAAAPENRDFAFSQPGMYGALCWHNDAVFADGKLDKEFVALSWRGNPTRHGAVPSNYYINGLSEVEEVIPSQSGDDTTEYTVFGSYIYQKGEKVHQSPVFSWPRIGASRSLVLGAMQDADGIIYIVTLNSHYNAPENIWSFTDGHGLASDDVDAYQEYIASANSTNPVPRVDVRFRGTLTKPGFFIGVWARTQTSAIRYCDEGWELLAEYSHTRDRAAWFGKYDGTGFISSGGDIINITKEGSVISAVYTAKTVDTSGSYSHESGAYAEETTFNITMPNYYRLFEYHGVTVQSGVVSLSFTAQSTMYSGSWKSVNEIGEPGTPANHHAEYTETSSLLIGTTSYCAFPEAPLSQWNFPVQPTACSVQDWLGNYLGPGITRAVWHTKVGDNWEGDYPGIRHVIDTNFTISVCGAIIPIVVTDRVWNSQRSPQLSLAATDFMSLNVSEHCTVTTSTIHFLDQRYNVCLYKKTVEEIVYDRYGRDVEYFTTTPIRNIYVSNMCPILEDDYTATLTETWHLVVDGTDTVVSEVVVPLMPFGEPMAIEGYQGVTQVIVQPRPSLTDVPVEVGSLCDQIGCYEYGYGDPYGKQTALDGGADYFYPEWCRYLNADPFWKAAAAVRFELTLPGAAPNQSAHSAYTPPEVIVEPIPVGSFARHPVLGDMYQFLLSRFDGSATVVSSANINAYIDNQLALAKNQDGTSKGLATHDTTLYYPISLY